MLVCNKGAGEVMAMRPCTVCLSLEEVELCMGQSSHPMEASNHENQYCHTDAHKVPAAGTVRRNQEKAPQVIEACCQPDVQASVSATAETHVWKP